MKQMLKSVPTDFIAQLGHVYW